MNIPEEVFYEEYKPKINHIVRLTMDRTVADEDICSFGGTMYETYGEEESYIRQMAKDSPRRVWTIIEADGGEPHIVAGFHYVNRMGFMITEKEWTTGDDEVENN